MGQVFKGIPTVAAAILGALSVAGCSTLFDHAPSASARGAARAGAMARPPFKVSLTVLDGSGAALHALSTAALDGQHAPGTDLVEHTYVETISRDQHSDAITARPGTFTTGFSYDLLPTVAQGHDMLLQMHLVSVELVELRTMDWAGFPVQLPITSTAAVDAVRLFPDGRGEATVELPRHHLESGRWSPVRRVRVAVEPVAEMRVQTAARSADTD